MIVYDNVGRATTVTKELGIDYIEEQREQTDLKKDVHGVWLHNLLWAGLDSGGLIEHYWWTENIETNPGPDGEPGMHEIFAYFQGFIQDIPLNNGRYEDSKAIASDARLRVHGQKDLSNQRAHLWVQNAKHTWRNVVDGRQAISGLAGTIILDGFQPETDFSLEWHIFTTQGEPVIYKSQTISDIVGRIIIELPSDPLITDIGLKIGDYVGNIPD